MVGPDRWPRGFHTGQYGIRNVGFKRLASWASLATVPEIARLEGLIGRSRPGAAPPERVVGRGQGSARWLGRIASPRRRGTPTPASTALLAAIDHQEPNITKRGRRHEIALAADSKCLARV